MDVENKKEAGAPKPESGRSETRFPVKFSAFCLMVIALGAWYHYKLDQRRTKTTIQAELTAVADLKISQLSNWRNERISDARFFSRASFVAKDLQRYLAEPDSALARQELKGWLNLLKAGDRYEEVTVLDTGLRVVLRIPEDPKASKPERWLLEDARQVLSSGEIRIVDLHQDESAQVHMEILFPVFSPTSPVLQSADPQAAGPDAKIGVVLLRLNPRQFLYPMLSDWPLPSHSAEIALLRIEGDKVLHLNDLARQGHKALTTCGSWSPEDFRTLSATNSAPAIKEATNSAGEARLFVGRAVPDTGWFLSASMKQSEVYAPIRRQAYNNGAAAVILGLAVLGGLGVFWRQREANVLRLELKSAGELEENRRRLQLALTASNMGVWQWDIPDNRFYCSGEGRNILGLNRSPESFDEFFQLVHRDDAARFQASLDKARRERGDFQMEFRLLRPDGSERWLTNLARPQMDAAGKVVQLVGTLQDITERKHAEQELRHSQERFSKVFHASPTVTTITSFPKGRYLDVNEQFVRMLGFKREQVIGRTSLELGIWVDPEQRKEMLRLLENQGSVRGFECRFRSAQGKVFTMLGAVEHIEVEERDCLLGIYYDITDQKRAEERRGLLSAAAAELGLASTREQAGEIIINTAKQLIGWDACFIHLYDEALGLMDPILSRDTVDGQVVSVDPPDRFLVLSDSLRKVLAGMPQLILRDSGGNLKVDLEPFGDKGRLSASLMFVPLREADRSVGILSIQSYSPNCYDQTSLETLQMLADYCVGALLRIRAEESLKRSERYFRSLIENASDIITVMDRGGIIQFQSPSIFRLWGHKPEEMLGRSGFDYVHPDDLPVVMQSLGRLLQEPSSVGTVDYRFRDAQGGWRMVQSRGCFLRDSTTEGSVIINSRDITESRALEERYRQAQKMEAFGQLAGGVAHDFNNMLTVIQGNASLLQASEGLNAPDAACVEQLLAASERAAKLTRQLLMFSRKQVMQLNHLDLSEVVGNMTKMLRRILGEDISLHSEFAPGLPMIHGDAGMIEQVLMNLVVNARDAMPGGGRMTIATSVERIDDRTVESVPGAKPGDFVCLKVSDTGLGISPENMAHIFEPFFTTKEVGKGTGLGLATVYGIVEQHHGWIRVQSELGLGTTFHIYLPPSLRGTAERLSFDAKAEMPKGTEIIMLAEDDPSVRHLVNNLLKWCGYTVLSAASGVEALKIWEENRPRIQLLLTDMVMPEGVSGLDLARRLKADRPDLKVIFTTGYSTELAKHDGSLVEGVNLLRKPYPLAKLARMIRERLDQV